MASFSLIYFFIFNILPILAYFFEIAGCAIFRLQPN